MPKRKLQSGLEHKSARRTDNAQAALVDIVSEAILELGGGSAVAQELGCSPGLPCEWKAQRSRISERHAAHLIRLIRERSGRLPGLAAGLEEVRKQAALRASQVRGARIARLKQCAPASHNAPLLTSEERRAKRERDRRVSERVRAGEDVGGLAREYGVQERTIEKWARRGGGLV